MDLITATAEDPFAWVKVQPNADYTIGSNEVTNTALVNSGATIAVEVLSSLDYASDPKGDAASYIFEVRPVSLTLEGIEITTQNVGEAETTVPAVQNNVNGVYEGRIQPEKADVEKITAILETGKTGDVPERVVRFGYLKMPDERWRER